MNLRTSALITLLILPSSLFGDDVAATPTVFGITPLTLIWLAAQSQSPGGTASQSNQLGPGGSLYFGGAQGNRESLLGLSVYSDFIDLNLQNRVYWSMGNAGLFAGTFASVELLNFRYFEDPLQGMTLTNDQRKGTSYLLAGVRLGGNVGFRMNFGGFGLTPRIGLTVPVFYLFDSFHFDTDKNLRFYELNAFMRALEIGLTIDWGIKEIVSGRT